MDQLPTELITEIFNLRHKLMGLDFITTLNSVHESMRDNNALLDQMMEREKQYKIFNTYWPQGILIFHANEEKYTKSVMVSNKRNYIKAINMWLGVGCITLKALDWISYNSICQFKDYSEHKTYVKK